LTRTRDATVSAGRGVACLAAVAGLLGLVSGCAAPPIRVPELDRPRTQADELPGEWRFSTIWPDTARLVGTVGGSDVFVGVGPSRAVRNDVHFCLIVVEQDGTGATCGRLPVEFTTSRLELQLVGRGAEPADGFRLLGESVLVAD
jgi:hypothetical protein